MGLADRGLLDPDASYLALADDEVRRRERYKAYMRQGASDKEIALLRSAWARNQLTGNRHFIDEIEQRIGQRIDCRGRGKPKSGV